MRSRILGWTLLTALATTASSAQQLENSPARAKYGQLPQTFEANRGQMDPRAKFISRGSGYTAFLTSDGMVLSLRARQAVAGRPAVQSGLSSSKRDTLQFRLLGAAPNASAVGENLQAGRVNYFVGNNPQNWHTNVPIYAQVRYKNIYRGIDLVYYGSHRQLEYDFAISAGADPSQIRFQILGAKQLRIDSQGDLVLETGSGELHFQAPLVYVESHGQRVPVPGGYLVDDADHVSFHLAPYDRNKPLVIDPVLLYSTYLGGSGDDQPSGIAVDAAGNVYVAGSTDSTDFPLTTLGSLPAGNTHVFVAKLDASGSNLIYTDYLSGNSYDYGYALAIDDANNLYVTGSTASSNFPLVNPYQGTIVGTFDAFLTKISPDGSSLVYSTYFGGTGSNAPSSIAVDAEGDMIIAGYTSSTDLPVANAYQPTVSANGGGLYGNYGFLTKFRPDGSSLVYSTFLGGNLNQALNCGGTPCWESPNSLINGMAVDSAGNAYVGGSTNTYNFPVTQGAYLTTNQTQQNGLVGFVSKFSSSGSIQYSTYFYDPNGIVTAITAIAVDGSSSAYVTGISFSFGSTFPVTSTGICDPSIYGPECNYAFVSKFNTTGSSLLYSTFLGPNNNASPLAIVLDQNTDAYVLASTGGGSFSTVNGIENYSSGNDVLLVEIDPVASTQLFATYLGGSGDDEPAPAGIVVDASGNIYATGMTDSSDLPVTQSAFQGIYGGSTDGFILKIGTGSAPALTLSPYALQFASQNLSSTSQPQTVILRNMGSAALSISSITITGDFSEVDTCASSVQVASSCTLSITFTPTAPGQRTGSVVIQDDATGSPHIIGLSGTGSGPAATVTPASLDFSSQMVGTSSAAQTVTITNNGNAALAVSNVQVTGDFAQTNNCPATVAPSASCAVTVTFTPTASGIRSGTLTINDNAQNTPQTVSLSGTGSLSAPAATVTPSALTFSSQAVGTSSAAQTIAVTSSGSAALNLNNIQVTGGFAQTNNCPATLAPGSSCTINVTFTPTASGIRSGALTINDGAQNSPQTVSLSGTGADFSLAGTPTSDTIPAGSPAIYTLSVVPVGGAFTNAIKIKCSGAPAHATCSLSSSSVTPGSSRASVTLTINTTATSAEAVLLRPAANRPSFAVWMQLQGLGLFGVMLAGSKRRSKRLPALLVLAIVVAALLFLSACAGGTGIVPQTQTGTVPGTYSITVTGASGSLQHSVPLTLTVQ